MKKKQVNKLSTIGVFHNSDRYLINISILHNPTSHAVRVLKVVNLYKQDWSKNTVEINLFFWLFIQK